LPKETPPGERVQHAERFEHSMSIRKAVPVW